MKIKGIPYTKVKFKALQDPQVLKAYLQEKKEFAPIKSRAMTILKMNVVMDPWPRTPYSLIKDKNLITNLYPWFSFAKYIEKSPDFFIPRDDVF